MYVSVHMYVCMCNCRCGDILFLNLQLKHTYAIYLTMCMYVCPLNTLQQIYDNRCSEKNFFFVFLKKCGKFTKKKKIKAKIN